MRAMMGPRHGGVEEEEDLGGMRGIGGEWVRGRGGGRSGVRRKFRGGKQRWGM